MIYLLCLCPGEKPTHHPPQNHPPVGNPPPAFDNSETDPDFFPEISSGLLDPDSSADWGFSFPVGDQLSEKNLKHWDLI